jgi:hypothetical protein
MKPIRILLFLGFSLFLISGADPNDGAFDAQINTLKAECKEMLQGARYEGAKVTYYTPSGSKQMKNIELFMFLSNEYVFAVSGKKCSVPFTVRLYDAAPDVEERTLIREFKGQQGKNFSFSSAELNRIYRKKVPEVERLKNLHVEYSLGSGNNQKEAVVLVFGHK